MDQENKDRDDGNQIFDDQTITPLTDSTEDSLVETASLETTPESESQTPNHEVTNNNNVIIQNNGTSNSQHKQSGEGEQSGTDKFKTEVLTPKVDYSSGDFRKDYSDDTAKLLAPPPAHAPTLTRHNIRHIDGDAVWNFLHRFGRFQMLQMFLLTVVSLTLSFAILQGVFVGKAVTPRCQANISSGLYSNGTLVIDTCTYSIQDNTSGSPVELLKESCDRFTYGSEVPVSFIAEWQLVCSEEALASLPQLLTMLGMMCGAALLPQLGDRYGRWALIFGCSLCHAAVNIGLAFVPNFEVFLFLKFLSGSCNQGIMVPYATMIIETFTTELRLFIGFILTVHWTVSVCFLTPFAYFMQDYNWRTLQLAYGITSFITFLPILFLSESTRWLLLNRKVKATEKLMRKACKMNKKNYDDLLKAVLPRPQEHINEPTGLQSHHKGQGQATMMDVMRSPVLRRMSLTICYGWLISSLTYYGVTMLSTSLAGDQYINFFIGGFLELPSAFMMWFVVQKAGRVRGIMFFLMGSALTLMAATLVATLAEKTNANSIAQTILTLSGKFFISASFNALWIYTPEVYPTNLRNVGTGISSTCARIGACSSPFFSILAKKVLWAPGALFAGGCLVGVLLMTFLPETGWRELPKTLTEVEGWFTEEGRQAARKKTSGKHAPVEYSTLDQKNRVV